MTTTERTFHRERVTIQSDAAKARVEETADAWIFADCIMTTDGVMNGARKTREELARTWMLAEGIPLAHEHPGDDEFGLVIDDRRLAGFVANVRFDDATGNVTADYYLLKHSLPGFDITPENVRRNEVLVAAVRAGVACETSIGFWSQDEQLESVRAYEGPNKAFEGDVYDRVQRTIMYDHNAFVPQGACGPTCSVGGAPQANALHDHAHAQAAREPKKDGTNMATTPQDMQLALDRLKQQATDAEKAVKAGCDKVAVLETKLDAALKTIDALKASSDAAEKARVDEKRAALAKLTGKDQKDLPMMDEAALTFAIERELSFRGHADGSMIARNEAPEKPVKDGLRELPGGGFTVVDMNKAVKTQGLS